MEEQKNEDRFNPDHPNPNYLEVFGIINKVVFNAGTSRGLSVLVDINVSRPESYHKF